MRFVSRLHLCAVATILMVLYFTCIHPSVYIESSVQAIWRSNARRIVVFGNDWSDTKKYRVSSPPRSERAPRDADSGEVWVETLCRELACDVLDNFARSLPSNAGTADVGSLLDSSVFEQAKGAKSNGIQMPADFKTQVEHFVTYNKGRGGVPARLRGVDKWTVFTVFFGLWELLEYSTLEKAHAMLAIDNSIGELFQSLDILAKDIEIPLKVVIPRMIDVTILPRFQSTKNATQEQFAERQHLLVFLWTYWNTVLLQSATKWTKGEVYMPNPNAQIVEQIRVGQLHSRQISDASGIGEQAPLFDYVEQPCLVSKKKGGSATNLQSAAVEKCIDPSQHLFWDEIQLSGSAHQLIGAEAASLIRGNQTVNIVRMQGAANPQESKGQEGANFKLKFPPGY